MLIGVLVYVYVAPDPSGLGANPYLSWSSAVMVWMDPLPPLSLIGPDPYREVSNELFLITMLEIRGYGLGLFCVKMPPAPCEMELKLSNV
jgi:hypothetical protein